LFLVGSLVSGDKVSIKTCILPITRVLVLSL